MRKLARLSLVAVLASFACGGNNTKATSYVSRSAIPDRTQAIADGQDAITVTATVTQSGKPVAGVEVKLSATGTGNQTAPATSDGTGVAHLSLRSTVAEDKTLSLSFTDATSTTNLPSIATVHFFPGAAAVARFDAQPVSTTAGVPFAQPIAASVYDANGNRVLDSSVHVALALKGHAGGLAASTETVDSSGEHNFPGLAVTLAGTGLQLEATVPGLAPVDSNPFDVTAAAPDAAHSALELDRPSLVADGQDLATGAVHVTDAFGNPIAGIGATVVSSDATDVLLASSGTTGTDGRMSWSLSTRNSGSHALTASAAGFTVGATLKAMPRFALGFRPMVDAFAPDTELVADPSSSSVSSGDLDGDGAPDFVMATNFFDHVAVLFNQGDGTFLRPLLLGSGLSPARVAISDVDGDQLPDVLVMEQSGRLTTFHNNGQHRFASGQTFESGVTPNGLPTFADLDGDGVVDVLIPTSSGVAVLHGDGSGTFSASATIAVASPVLQVAAGDVNEDGHSDLLVRTQDGNSTVLIADGSGGWTVGASYALSASGEVLADVTADGHLDLVAESYSGLFVLPGDGTGAFDSSRAAIPSSADSSAPLVVDLNGDGYPEVVGLTQHGLFVFPGGSTGLGAGFHVWTVGGLDLIADDFDRDGHLDVLVAGEFGAQLVRGDGAGAFVVPPVSSTPPNAYASLLGDLNNDHVADLVEYGLNTVAVSLGNGDGSFQAASSFTPSLPLVNVQAVDVDGDGNLDLIARSTRSADPLLFRGNGDGTFQPMETLPLGLTARPKASAVRDLDANGSNDFVGAGYGFLEVSLANGDGTFRTQTSSLPSDTPDGLCVADFNGDQILDLAVSDTAVDKIYIYRGLAGGTFSGPVQTVDVQVGYGGPPVSMVCRDVNHDGAAELIVEEDEARVRVFAQGSDGLLTEHQQLQGLWISGATTADLDQDGNLDLVTGMPDGLGLWLGNGKGEFTWYGLFSTPLGNGVALGAVDATPGDDLVQVDMGGYHTTLLNTPY